MAVNVNENAARFMAAKDRARKLIHMDANGSIDKIAKKAVNEGKITGGEDGFESSYMETYQHNNVSTPQTPSNTMINKSKLPSAIMESFKQKNIDTSLLGVNVGQASVLDAMGISEKPVMTEQVHKPITENIKSPQTSVSSNVDYSLVKTIVEDCMKRYMTSLKKSIIAENKSLMNEDNTLQAMKIGNKFTFIGKNGDLYEATLKKIGNINNK